MYHDCFPAAGNGRRNVGSRTFGADGRIGIYETYGGTRRGGGVGALKPRKAIIVTAGIKTDKDERANYE